MTAPRAAHADPARVAELVDAADLKSADRKVVPVRFRLRAPSLSFSKLRRMSGLFE
jgi:hypothetical protein